MATLHLFTEASHTTAGQTGADNAVSLGTEFYVTTTAWVTKVRFLRPTVGDASIRTMALFSTTNGVAYTWVGGYWPVTPGASGTWSSYTLPNSIQLVAGTRYRVVQGTRQDAGYAATGLYFSTGAGAATFTQGGFLVRPNATDAYSNDQGSYSYDIDFPHDSFNAANYWADVEVTDVDPGAGPTLVRKVGEYITASGAASNPVSIPLTATTPGTDLVMLANTAAVMTMPAGWVKTQVYISTTEWAFWRLPAYLHTTSLTSVTMSLSGARRVTAVVVESAPITSAITHSLNYDAFPFAGVWDTDYITINRSVGFAVFTAFWGGGGSSGTVSAVDVPYQPFADTGAFAGTGGADEATRIWLFKNEPAYLYIRMLHAATTISGFNDTRSGVIGWDVAQAWAFGAGTVTANASVTSGGTTVNGTATVAGVGAVTAKARQQPATTAVAGVGAVTAVGGATSGGTASVAGVGAVTAKARQQPATTALIGVGAVTALATQRGTVIVTGVGTVTASASVLRIATAAVTGVGAVNALATQRPATTTITGAGATTATGSVFSIVTASATGAGAVTALARQQPAAAMIIGAGSSTGLAVQTGTASVVGAGLTSALAVRTVTAAVVGAGSVTAVAGIGGNGAASVAGVGSTSALATQRPATTTLIGTGTVNASTSQRPAITAITGVGAVTATAVQRGTATVTGAGSATALVRQQAIASVTGTGTVTASSSVLSIVTASVTGAGTVTTKVTTIPGATTLAGVGAINANSSGASGGTASVAGAGTVTAKATLRPGTKIITGTGTVIANSGGIASGTAAVAGVGTVTAKAAQRSSTVTITGLGTVTASGSVIAAAISGTASVTGLGAVAAMVTQTVGALSTGLGTVTATGTSEGVGPAMGTASIAGIGAVTATKPLSYSWWLWTGITEERLTLDGIWLDNEIKKVASLEVV